MPSKSERRRQQLLDLGVQLFANKPYDEVVIEDLAAAAGASKGLLYHYFGSKKAFYLTCVRIVALRLVDELRTIDSSDPVSAVEEGLSRFLDYLDRHGRVYRSLLTGSSGSDLGADQLFDEVRGAIAALILLQLGVDPTRPCFRSTVRAWIGAIEGAALDRLAHSSPSREAFISMQVVALADRLLHAHHLDPDDASTRAAAAAQLGRERLLAR
jgi:AcrR family transcriptional regulator